MLLPDSQAKLEAEAKAKQETLRKAQEAEAKKLEAKAAKAKDAAPFIRTWMMASPTFNGLRLSLSESSRLRYGEKPDTWAECIQHVLLKNDKINIDVELTPGLNVVIGGSSSGKTLFVDSIYRKIVGDYDELVVD